MREGENAGRKETESDTKRAGEKERWRKSVIKKKRDGEKMDREKDRGRKREMEKKREGEKERLRETERERMTVDREIERVRE